MAFYLLLLFLYFFENLVLARNWVVFLKFYFTLNLLTVLSRVVYIRRLRRTELNDVRL